jgi:hypothetical protein
MDPAQNLPPDILDVLKEIEQGPPAGVDSEARALFKGTKPLTALKSCHAIGFCEYLAKADKAQRWQWRRGMTYLDLGSPEELAHLAQIIDGVPVEGIHSTMFLHLFHKQGDSYTRSTPITGVEFLPQISYYARVLSMAFSLPHRHKPASQGGAITSTAFQLYGSTFERMVLLARLAVLRARIQNQPQPQDRLQMEREIDYHAGHINFLNRAIQAFLIEMDKDSHSFERSLFSVVGDLKEARENNLGAKPFRVELKPAA